jgi:hypothetical protein
MPVSKISFTIFVFVTSVYTAFSQSISKPNYSLKSHETLEINKIATTEETTIIYLSIENRRQDGSFCADKNIFIVYPDGNRSKLISTSGIPVCPDTYKFKYIGEKLDFVLTFPRLKPGTEWIDLVEDCYDNCFSFYGVTLDNDLNQKINNAFSLAENDESAKAMISFIDILESIDSKNIGAEGLLYINIIKLAKETGSSTQASEWYKKFKSSGTPRLAQYIKYLNDQGIKDQ